MLSIKLAGLGLVVCALTVSSQTLLSQATGKINYVDSENGNARNSGLTKAMAVASISQAVTLVSADYRNAATGGEAI